MGVELAHMHMALMHPTTLPAASLSVAPIGTNLILLHTMASSVKCTQQHTVGHTVCLNTLMCHFVENL